MRTDPRQERALDLATRGIGLVEDAALGVAAFAGEVELARARRIRCARGVELDAVLAQCGDRVRAALDDEADGVLAAEARPGVHRVLDVGVEGVLGVRDGGNPALGPVGCGIAGLTLRDDRDVAHLGDPEGVVHTGQAGADHEEVERVGRVRAASGRGLSGSAGHGLSVRALAGAGYGLRSDPEGSDTRK